MSSRRGHSLDSGGNSVSARKLSSADSKDMIDQGGGGEDESLQLQYSIPRFVSKVYYRLGLLCATHPRFVLILTFIVIVWSCFPLFSLPIYSTRPQINVQPFHTFVREDQHGKHLSESHSTNQRNTTTSQEGKYFIYLAGNRSFFMPKIV